MIDNTSVSLLSPGSVRDASLDLRTAQSLYTIQSIRMTVVSFCRSPFLVSALSLQQVVLDYRKKIELHFLNCSFFYLCLKQIGWRAHRQAGRQDSPTEIICIPSQFKTT